MALASPSAIHAESPHVRIRYLPCACPVERGESGDMIDVLFTRGAPELQPVFSGRRRRRLAPGEGVCVVPPQTRYGLEAGGPWEVLSLSLDLSVVARYLGAGAAGAFSDDRVAAVDPFLQKIAAALRCGLRCGCLPSEAYLESVAAPIARHLADSYGRGASSSDGLLAAYRLHRVRAYVAAHHAQPIGLRELAGAAGLSTFHFARTFRRATGETPHAYVTRTRIEEAQRLLAETDLPLEEIARRVGYRTHSHFSSAFRRLVGITPTRFRRG